MAAFFCHFVTGPGCGSVEAQVSHPGAGEQSVTLLNVGLGPVGAGMSDGLTGWSGISDAVFWNPAAVSTLASEYPEVVLSGATLLGVVRQTFLQYGTRLGRAGLALQLIYSSVGDIEIRGDEPTPEPLALGSAHDFVAGVTIGLPLPSGAGLGVTVKGIYEKLHLADAFGIAADVGVQLPLPVLNGLFRAGIAIRNVGSMGALENERLELPWSMAIGIALAKPVEWGNWIISAGGDVWKPTDDWTQLRVGLEAAWDVLKFRAGTRQGKGWGTISAGIGIVMPGWSLNYAYIYDPDPSRHFLGTTQKLGVSIPLRKGTGT